MGDNDRINLGLLTSLIYCDKCGLPINITFEQDKVECPGCKQIINLKIDFNL